MTPELPDEFVQALERLRQRFHDFPELEQHAARINEQYQMTRREADTVEYLLGRTLTSGEISWIHRRLHYGLHLPGDAELDYDLEDLDAAYRERLVRSDSGWRGPLDDLPEQLRDLFPDA